MSEASGVQLKPFLNLSQPSKKDRASQIHEMVQDAWLALPVVPIFVYGLTKSIRATVGVTGGAVAATALVYHLSRPASKSDRAAQPRRATHVISLEPAAISVYDLPSMRPQPKPEERFRFDQARVDEYLGMIRTDQYRDAIRTLIENTDVLTLDQLKIGISTCVQEFKRLVGDEPFSLGIFPQKSSEWIGQYAMQHLSQAPASTFRHSADCSTGSYWSLPDPISEMKETTFVIFDDACYSGDQMMNIFRHFCREAEGSKKKYKLCLVYPFVSERALERMKNSTTPHNLEVHLITTSHRIKTWQDVLDDDPFGHNAVFKDPQGQPKCLAITEWKVPDAASFPTRLTGFVRTGRLAPWPTGESDGEDEYVSLIQPDRDTLPIYKRSDAVARLAAGWNAQGFRRDDEGRVTRAS